MKLLNLVTFLTALALTFSACGGPTPSPSDRVVIDKTLPVISLTKTGIFTDMTSIAFEWNEITDPRVNGIYVYKQVLGEDATDFKFHKTIESRFVTHYIDEDLDPKTQYAYYFKTFTKKSESNPSKNFLVNTLPVLDSVSWIHAVTNMPRSAKIIWRPHTNQIVEKYLLQRATLETNEWEDIKTLNGRLRVEYIDEKLHDGFVYKYRIKVLTYNDIVSKPSVEVKVVTKQLPKQIKNILATKNLPKQIRLNWTPSEINDFSHYTIYRADKINGIYKVLVTVKDIEYIDKINEDGKDYFYRVSTVDRDGLESIYKIKSTHGRTLVKPETPSLVEAKMVGDNLVLNWSVKDSSVESFMIIKKSQNGWFDVVEEKFVNIKHQRYTDRTIAPKTKYTYIIYSVDEFGIQSEASMEVLYETSKKEGKNIVVQKVDSVMEVRKSPKEKMNVIQPMDDIDVSSL